MKLNNYLIEFFKLDSNTTVFFGTDDNHGIVTFDWNDQVALPVSLLLKYSKNRLTDFVIFYFIGQVPNNNEGFKY